MKLFSKVTFICNISFIVFIILRYVDFNTKKGKVDDNLMPLPFITGSLVVLGQLSIFINIIFCLTALILLISKKLQQIPKWLVIANFTMLFVQFYYFFIY
jgi:phosphatidylserine synthase